MTILSTPPNFVHHLLTSRITSYQKLWGYVSIAFNKVDTDRLNLVGPDRLCAEWVLKNGGAVSFVQTPGRFLKDYNILPPEKTKIEVKEIDATDSSIMRIGFDHLKSCKSIVRIILHRCKHLESDGLQGLSHIKDTLQYLQVSSCYNINDDGLKVLKEMTKLKTLHMFDLIAVKDLKLIADELKSSLPGCVIKTKE